MLSTVTIIMVVLAFSVFILLFSFNTLSIYYKKNAILFKAGTYMLLEIQRIFISKRDLKLLTWADFVLRI